MKSRLNSIFTIGILLSISFYSLAQGNIQNLSNNQIKKQKMDTIHRNKEVIRKLFEQSLNQKNLELLKDFISEDFVGITGKKGAFGFEEPFIALIKAFPDLQYKIDELIGEGDKVVIKWKLQGTHTGKFQSVEATGKAISNNGMAIFELIDGKIINSQVLTDRLGFLQELDVLPLDLTLLSNKKAHRDHVRFIDKFFVPANAKNEFLERMRYNRSFIKTLPGFIKDEAYLLTDDSGNLTILTIAVWENEQVVSKAREAVQAEYNRIGFKPLEFYQRLNIKLERGIYHEMSN